MSLLLIKITLSFLKFDKIVTESLSLSASFDFYQLE